jgi:hypothetical protein
MATTIDTYVEERLRLALTGSISGQTMDSFIRATPPPLLTC